MGVRDMAYRILLAEDDPQIREVVSDYFAGKTEEALTLVCAQDGTEALEQIRLEQFDLLMLDVMMPGIDGFSLCREVRADSDIPQRETLDLVALAKEAFALLQEDTEKRGITIRFSGNCKASANTAMMTRAIENLAANAVRYTPENGCIDVTGQNDVFRISNDADTAQITDADQLCEPFVKGNSARTSGAGSGMGLAIVKQTAKLHGFRFRTESENGKFIAKLETKK